LGRLVENALGELERLEYSRRSRDRYRAIWTYLIEFSHQRKLGDEFSADLAACFVEEYRMGDEEVDKPGEGWRRHIVLGVKALENFAHHGRIERAVTDTEKILLLPAIEKVLRDYEQYGKDRLQLRPSTLRTRTRELTIFLDFSEYEESEEPGPDSGAGSVRIPVFSGSFEAEHRLTNRL
jgi:hypothetical protein